MTMTGARHGDRENTHKMCLLRVPHHSGSLVYMILHTRTAVINPVRINKLVGDPNVSLDSYDFVSDQQNLQNVNTLHKFVIDDI